MFAGLAGDQPAHPVDVALDDVPAEPSVGGQGALQVHRGADPQAAEGAAAQRLGHQVGGEVVAVLLGHGQADPVDGDRVAVPGSGGGERAADPQPGGVPRLEQVDDAADLLDDSGEHQWSSLVDVPGAGRGSRVRRMSGPSRTTSVMANRAIWSMLVMPRSLTAVGPAPSRAGAR